MGGEREGQIQLTEAMTQPDLPKQEGVFHFVSTGPTIKVGGFLLRELSDGTIWIESEFGEGMTVRPEHLAPVLEKFFSDNF